VCIGRIPKNISIIFPRSRCDCGRPIPFYLNVPIISWILLGGKARCCGRKLEFQYIFMEILTAILFLLLWVKFAPLEFFVYGIFFGLLIIASGIDFLTMTIPDRCTIGGAILGILGSVLLAHFSKGNYIFCGGIVSLRGMLLGSSILLWIAVFAEFILNREAIGFGDVKLMGCIGAFLGTRGAIFSIFGGTCLGMVTIFPIWWLCNRQKSDIKLGSPLPFGPFLALGAVAYLLFFKVIVDEYFAQIEILLS
jgi:leader peptidase (prepilin peptidase)/N-methyltransferase